MGRFGAGRAVVAGGLGAALLASMLVVPVGRAGAEVPARSGADAATPVNSVPASVYRPDEPEQPKVASPAMPPSGTKQRAFFDRAVAQRKASTERIKARLHPIMADTGVTAASMTVLPPVTAAGRLGGPADARVAAGADECAQEGGEQWFALYSGGTAIVAPTANNPGVARVGLTNSGSGTWPAGSSFLSYRLFDSDTNEILGDYPQTPLPMRVSSGGSTQVDAAIAPLKPGTWRVLWDLWISGVGWLSDNFVCAFNVKYVIPNQRATLSLSTPPNFGTVLTRTPKLWVVSADPDLWPSGGDVTFQFKVCKNSAMTVGCHTSAAGLSLPGYQVPAGVLAWNDTFWWSARVFDGQDYTPETGFLPPSQASVVVPSPDPWRTVGAGLGLANVAGVVLPYGIWVQSEVDAEVQGYGLPLRVERTYSSGAVNTFGVFGYGWLSLFDASAQYSADGQLLTVTYPDGRQEVFGRKGSGWVGRLDSGATNRVSVAADGVITVRTAGQEVVSYGSDGELRSVAHAGQGAIDAVRDAAGRIRSLVQRPSGRALTVTWTSDHGTGCGKAYAPVISEIASEGPAGGDPLRWRYRYSCGKLAERCDPDGHCTSYWVKDSEGTWFSVSPQARKVAEPTGLTGSWSLTSFPVFEWRRIYIRADGQQHVLELQRPVSDPHWHDWYLNDVNSYGGILVEVSLQLVGTRARQDETYRFDELNRLRSLTHGRSNIQPAAGNYRVWEYSEVDGRLWAYFDENFNSMEMIYDGDGNLTGTHTWRDADTLVTHDSFYQPVPGGDPNETRVAGIMVSPRQDLRWRADMFTYDPQGRLVRRTGNATAEAPDGPVTNFTYTTGAEAPVGPRRGGSGSSATMPAGLPRTVSNAEGTVTYSYNVQGDLTQVFDPVGRRVGYEYDHLGRRIAEIEYSDTYPRGVRTEFRLDGVGRVVEEIYPPVVNQVTGVSQQRRVCRTYERDGLPVMVVETAAADCPEQGPRRAGDRTTHFSYDPAKRLIQTIDAAGGITHYSYVYSGADEVDFDLKVIVTDPRGRTRQSWYQDGRLIVEQATVGSWEEPVAARNQYFYDPAGRLLEAWDALGRKTAYTWTPDDLLATAVRRSVRQADGGVYNYELFNRKYDGSGKVISEVTQDGRQQVRTVYDNENKVIDLTVSPSGSATRNTHYGYDLAGRLILERTTGVGAPEEVRYSRDPAGAIRNVAVQNGSESLYTSIVRDQRGYPTQVIDPRRATSDDPDAFKTLYGYDELGRPTSVTSPPVTVEADNGSSRVDQPAEVYGYNAFGELTHARDAHGNVTETLYDDAGRIVEIRGPPYTPPGSTTTLHPTIRRQYNIAGEVVSETDARGNTTTYEYDRGGNLVKATPPKTGSTPEPVTYTYDLAGQLTSTTDATGAVTQFAYDALGRPVATTRVVRQPEGEPIEYITSIDYDRSGGVTTVSPGGYRTLRRYDPDGRLRVLQPPGVTPTLYSYDHAGRLISVQDPAGRLTEYLYDEAGRLYQEHHRASPGGTILDPTTYRYDNAGNLISRRAPNGTVTTYTVDAANRVTTIRQPTGASTYIDVAAGYDAAGNRVRFTDGRGNTTRYGYNTQGQLETVTEPTTTAHPQPTDRRWTTSYDAGGLPVKLVKPGGVTIDRDYDALGQLTAETASGGGTTPASRTFGYDRAGRLERVDHPSGSESFNYSDRGLMLGAYGPAGNTDYFYDADGRISSRNDAAGTSYFTWRGDGQLATARNTTNPAAGEYKFIYNPNSGELTRTEFRSGTSQWQYDDRGRVASIAVKNLDGTALSAVNYGYDANGNITSKNITAGPHTGGGTFSYDHADRLVSWHKQDGGTIDYAWDASGNRTRTETSDGTRTDQTYDTRNRLTSSTTKVNGTQTSHSDYSYTPRGTLSETTHDDAPPRPATFDGFDRLIADGPITYSYDSLDRLATRTATGTTTFKYTGLLADPTQSGTETYWRSPTGSILSGNLGGTNLLPAIDGHNDLVGWSTIPMGSTLTASTGFDPFGLPTSESGVQANVGFQGDWTDPDTGRVNMHARWYDPHSATFASRDDTPFPLDAGAQLNRYGYGAANPLTNTDPTGRAAGPATICVAAPAVCRPLTPAEVAAWDQIVAGLRAGTAAVQMSGATATTAATTATAVGAPELLAVAAVLAAGALLLSAMHNQSPNAAYPIYDAVRRDWYRPGNMAHPDIAWCGCGRPAPRFQAEPTPTTPQPRPRPPAPPPPAPTITKVSTETITRSWSDPLISYASPGYRNYRRDTYTETWARTLTELSDGTSYLSDWQLQAWTYSSRFWQVRTVDPERIDKTIKVLGPSDDVLISPPTQARDGEGLCGITGTLISCLAESLTTVVGGGCIGTHSNLRGCTPTEPQPGNPGALRETAPAQGQLADACFTGRMQRADGTTSAGQWTCGGGAAASGYDPEFPTIKLDNYRGRFNAFLNKNGIKRLPQDWDAHHAIPQEYRSHPGFADFDFDAPANIRGVPGSRMNSRGANVHQDITNQWKWFRDLNPNPTRAEIEDFALQIDRGYGAYYWRETR
ncbi:RHS repeat-associated core domain-containing protein [Micromonospora sp. NPDC093277]|uniref:RHS repeat-associated core domain-containing protein n=1 Tax=Micromonospora sp. NPDC093277 TaxID=3364291 RepID=UPI0037FE1B1D